MNKLVKRPQSQHLQTHPSFAQAPTPSSSLSRRPATSYQRSALQHRATHSLDFEPSLAVNLSSMGRPRTEDPRNNYAWEPFFGTKSDGFSGKMARRLSIAGRQKDQSLRRIIPKVDAAPTLVLGKFLTNKHCATNSEKNECYSSPQPSQPQVSRLPANITRFSENFSLEDENSRPDPQSSSPDPMELVGPRTLVDSSKLEKINAQPLACVKDEEPGSPSNEHSKSEQTVMGSPHTSQKRNITDPRTHASEESSMPLMTGIRDPRRRIISYPLSREAKVRMGHRREATKRPSTSDAVAPPTLQHVLNRQTELNLPFALGPRNKRHSIAASEPASTVIGSDDTRVFTSADEDETDFFSDVAFDSIRTHLTTYSNPAARGPLCETMFDKNPDELIPEEQLKLEGLIAQDASDFKRFDEHSNMRDSDEVSEFITTRGADRGALAHSSTDLSPEDNHKSLEPLHQVSGQLRQQLDPLLTSKVQDDHTESVTQNLNNLSAGTLDLDPKMNIFDWSEQPLNDRETSGIDSRPRTVHGKQGDGLRGSRIAGRKAPSMLHLRSQSVPTIREAAPGNDSHQTGGKFGTWGLGSKGVSEDWDNDFDFDDADAVETSETKEPSEDNFHREMVVPQAIMEQQDSLHGQYGLVQELTLLVEELKRLRQQATFLGIVPGSSSELWNEAESIVNLATIDEENENSPPRSPSSLSFSFDESEEESSKRGSGARWQASFSKRASGASSNSDRLGEELTPKPKFMMGVVNRPDSYDLPAKGANGSRARKLPFDTQSLRGLVFRTSAVTRALKDVVREAEGVATAPGDGISPDPPFSRIFDKPHDGNFSEFETPCIA